MGYDCSIMIRTDFRKRHDKEATLKKLEETAAILNNAEGANSYVVRIDDTFDKWCITEGDDEQFFMNLELYNGFWHMETGFGYFQCFEKLHTANCLKKIIRENSSENIFFILMTFLE